MYAAILTNKIEFNVYTALHCSQLQLPTTVHVLECVSSTGYYPCSFPQTWVHTKTKHAVDEHFEAM